MRVAIVHPIFLELGGAERVLEVIASLYPNADMYTVVADKHCIPLSLQHRHITESPLRHIKILNKIGIRTAPLYYTPILPWAIESLDLTDYDVIISDCNTMLMGVHTRPDAVHVCYCHTPTRSLWDSYVSYRQHMPNLLRKLFVYFASSMRIWEFCAAQRVNLFISNSENVAQRVSCYYRRNSVILYPPVKVEDGFISEKHENYYLHIGRLDATKRIDLLISACNLLGRKLIIAGSGKEEKTLKALAGSTITFLGRVDDSSLASLYSKCRAFLFAADEDCGMTPIEAQSYGKPVIAYGAGGSLETVCVDRIDGFPNTGMYFYTQTVDAVVEAIIDFEKNEHNFNATSIRRFSERFSTDSFKTKFVEIVSDIVQKRKYV